MNQTFDQTLINARLEAVYGVHPGGKLARFRVVWSEDQRVKRLGTYSDFYNETIFIREVTEVREVLKYPLVKDQWVIERLVPNLLQEEEGDYIYYIMYAFPTGLQLNYRAIELYLAHIFKRVKGQDQLENQTPKTQKDADWQEARRTAKKEQEVRDAIELTPLQIGLNDRSATTVPGFRDEVKKDEGNTSIDPSLPTEGR